MKNREKAKRLIIIMCRKLCWYFFFKSEPELDWVYLRKKGWKPVYIFDFPFLISRNWRGLEHAQKNRKK